MSIYCCLSDILLLRVTLKIFFRFWGTIAKTQLAVNGKNAPYVGGQWQEFTTYSRGQNTTHYRQLKKIIGVKQPSGIGPRTMQAPSNDKSINQSSRTL